MGKKKKRRRRDASEDAAAPTSPFNSPFGDLSGLREQVRSAPRPKPTPEPAAAATPAWGKLVVGAEKKGRAGKTVTRVKGVPASEVRAVAKQMKSALGCGATLEGGDLVVLGQLVERVVAWLEQRGAKKVVVSGGVPVTRARGGDKRSTAAIPRRADLRPGLTVDIVLKQDQASGTLTRGVVRDILTRSPTHPHGIKVRLDDGAVGRVKAIV